MSDKLKIVLGITGGIAIYKSAGLLRKLVNELGADVQVIMTASAQKFMTPLIFETFSGRKVWTSMFSADEIIGVRHVELAHWADVVLISPATANIIGKAANGIADDLLSTVILASGKKTIFAAAMESGMLDNPAVVKNVNLLSEHGFGYIEPASGALASGRSGPGRLVDNDEIIEAMKKHIKSHE